MTTQTNGDELERHEFERIMKLSPNGKLFDFSLSKNGDEYESGPTRIVFCSWRASAQQAALKSKQGEV